MLEPLSPSLWENFKPIEVMKLIFQEKAQLKKEVITNQSLIKNFVNYITKNYSEEELKDVTWWTDINTYISSQILDFKIEDTIEPVWSSIPWTKDYLSVYKEGKKMYNEAFWWPLQSLIDEYIGLRGIKPLDVKKIEEWMSSHGMGSTETKETEGKEADTTDVRSADDEEDLEDNKEYNYDFKKNSKFSNSMEKYISMLPDFTSVWYIKEGGVTYCSRTVAGKKETVNIDGDARRLYGLDWEEGNAFDVMRSKNKKFNTSIVSDLYKQKEKIVDTNSTVVDREEMGKSEYINTIAWDNNVVDLYVTSSTENWKKFWHRASMFRIGDQWFVIDPYTALQPWEQKNKPRTLESYALSMKTANNKREFMRMDFYKSDKLEQKIASVSSSWDKQKAVA